MPRNIRLKKPPEGYFWEIKKQMYYPWNDEAVLYRKVPVKTWGFPSTVIKRVGSVNLTMYGYVPPYGTTPTDEEKADTIFRLSEIEVEYEYRKHNIGEYSIELVD